MFSVQVSKRVLVLLQCRYHKGLQGYALPLRMQVTNQITVCLAGANFVYLTV
jgi:hypothetical protein